MFNVYWQELLFVLSGIVNTIAMSAGEREIARDLGPESARCGGGALGGGGARETDEIPNI